MRAERYVVAREAYFMEHAHIHKNMKTVHTSHCQNLTSVLGHGCVMDDEW